MPGREIDEPNVSHLGGRNRGAFVVDLDRHHLGANGAEGARRARIPGVLDANSVTRIQKEMRGEIERLLRAGNDRDLLGRAPHSA